MWNRAPDWEPEDWRLSQLGTLPATGGGLLIILTYNFLFHNDLYGSKP